MNDPINDLMDFQLRCRLSEQISQLINDDLPGPHITVEIGGYKTRHRVDMKSVDHQIFFDETEDAFIEALDRKYARVYGRDYRILEYLTMGYTQAEAGSIFGVSRRTVIRTMKKLTENVTF